MRRRSVHLAFGAAVLVCAALAGYVGLRLREAARVNEAIARAGEITGTGIGAGTGAATGTGAGTASGAGTVTGDIAPISTLPEAQFAQAVLLGKQRRYDVALERYKLVIRGNRADLATDALYNAGNLHFREALEAEGPDSAARMLPLIELAKQSYRAALRRNPNSWDARYNLERALWLAPELDESLSLSVPTNTEQRVMSTLRSSRGDLP